MSSVYSLLLYYHSGSSPVQSYGICEAKSRLSASEDKAVIHSAIFCHLLFVKYLNGLTLLTLFCFVFL